MTLDLDKLEALCEAATEGPWWVADDGSDEVWAGPDDVPTTVVADIQSDPDEDTFEALDAARAADAAFIAAARQAVPDLVAEVRRLREALSGIAGGMGDIEASDRPDYAAGARCMAAAAGNALRRRCSDPHCNRFAQGESVIHTPTGPLPSCAGCACTESDPCEGCL